MAAGRAGQAAKDTALGAFPGFRAGPVAGAALLLLPLDAVANLVLFPIIGAARGAVGIVRLIGLLRGGDYADGIELSSASESDLKHALMAAERRWQCWILVAAGLLSYGTVISPSSPWSAVGSAISLAGLATVYTLRAAYAHRQLLVRTALPFREFLCHPSAWLPADQPGVRNLITGLLAAVILSPAIAHAQAVATGSTTDLGTALIQSLFGTGTVPAGTAFTQSLGVMTSTLTLLGTGWLAFGTISGMMNVAYEGTVFSAKYHVMWAPIRIVFGIGMLVPLPSGLDGANLAVFEIAGFGNSLATAVWSNFVSGIESGANTATPAPIAALSQSPVFGLAVARVILEAESCVADAVDFDTISHETTPDPDSVEPPIGGTPDATGANQVWDYHSCGGISIPIASGTDSNAATYSQARISAISALISGVRATGLPTQIVQVIEEPEDGTKWPTSLIAPLQPLASTYQAALVSAAGTYEAAENSTTRAALTAQASQSWMSAGAYWQNLGQVSAQAAQLASEPPAMTGPSEQPKGWLPGIWPGSGSVQNEGLHEILVSIGQSWKAETETQTLSGADLAQAGNENTSAWDVVGRLTDPVAQQLSQYIVSLGTVSSADPMSTLVDLGHGMLLTSQSGLLAGIAAAWASGTEPSKLIGLDKGFDFVKPTFQDLLFACNVIGVFLAYILPMIPFISMYWLVVGWVLFLVEATIAAPIIALLFIKLDGEEFITHVHKPACNLLFNFAFLPVFGLLGLEAVYFVLPLVLGLLDGFFPASFAGQQGGHLIGLEGDLIGLGMLVYLTLQATLRCCSLVHSMPYQIPRWLGFSLDGVGGDVEKSHGGFYAALGRAGASAGRMGGKTGGSGQDGRQAGGVGGQGAGPASIVKGPSEARMTLTGHDDA